MHVLSQLLMAFMDVAEAEARNAQKQMRKFVEDEGRALRQSIVRILTAIVLLVLFLALMTVGCGIIFWGFYLLLEPPLGAAGSAFLTGFIAILVACLLMLTAQVYAK